MKLNLVRRYLVSIILLLGFGFGGYKWGVYTVESRYQDNSMVDTRVMNEVLLRLKKNYLKPEDIKTDRLMYGAAVGMTESL